MESNVTKIRQGNPIVDVLMADFWELINNDKFNGLTIAELVGTIEFVKNDLINGNWYG